MGGLTWQYIFKRFLMFMLTVWLGSSLIFIIPRMAPGDPVTAMVVRMTMREGYVENAQEIIESWKERFGLNDPLSIQYIKYLGNLVKFDFGYSLARFPAKAWDMVRPSLPWSIGLLLIASSVSFVVGNGIGALMGWNKTPKWIQSILPTSLMFTAIPYFMFGILLIYIFAFKLHWVPASGGYGRTVDPGWNIEFIKSVARHGILPLLSIVLTSSGGWALGMRGLMISANSEDHFLLAQAKGLKPVNVFLRYGVRNAIVPSLTAFALGLGGMISGSTLVEFIFAYPGTGFTLYQSIVTQDYTVMQTVCNLMIIVTSLGVFLIDLLYPLLDPRITFKTNK
ncbi:MAG: ABC transporter permease [Anaerolineaceae bacterium]|nr:ABC transporter permease [Anaerolineaceae bacterium]